MGFGRNWLSLLRTLRPANVCAAATGAPRRAPIHGDLPSAENCVAAAPAPEAIRASNGPGSVRGGVKGSLSATISPSAEIQSRFITQGRPSRLKGGHLSVMRPDTAAQLSTVGAVMMRSPEAVASAEARRIVAIVGAAGM